MVWDQAIVIGSDLTSSEEETLIQFLHKNRDVLPGLPKISWVWIAISSSKD
jgi:hypothetical protein